MAPFGISTTGFCMVFRCANLVFSTGTHFWILGYQIWIQEGSGWAGDLFGLKKGPRKTQFCGGNCFPWGLRGICARKLDCVVPRRLLGRPVSPPNLPENNFTGISQFPNKNPWAFWAFMVIPSAPLWGWPIQLPINPPWWDSKWQSACNRWLILVGVPRRNWG